MKESPPPKARAGSGPAGRVAEVVMASLFVTVEQVGMMAATLANLPHEPATPVPSPGRHAHDVASTEAERDGLVARGKEYASGSLRVLQTLRPRLVVRHDAVAIDAAERLEEMCLTIASKIHRAVMSAAESRHETTDPQCDANGSAKVALLLIEESRQAWRVLMQPGRAVGNGTPARFVRRLDELESGLHARFPRALEFIRPGFDTDDAGPAAEVARAMRDRGNVPKS